MNYTMKSIKQHILERLVLSKSTKNLPYIKPLFKCIDDNNSDDYELFGNIKFKYNDKIYEGLCEVYGYGFDNKQLNNTRKSTVVVFIDENDANELRKDTNLTRLPIEIEKEFAKLNNLEDKITKMHVWSYDEYIKDINDGGVGSCVNKDNVDEFIDWLKYFTEYTGKKFYSYDESFYLN